jgi:hypothetical protein
MSDKADDRRTTDESRLAVPLRCHKPAAVDPGARVTISKLEGGVDFSPSVAYPDLSEEDRNMNEDQLLHDLARRCVEAESHVPAHWQAFAAGTLPAAAEERLRAQARENEEIRDALTLFCPLGSDFQARMVAEMRARVKPRARLLAFPPTVRRQRWSQALAAMAALLVAALALPWLMPSQLMPSHDGTPVPSYSVKVRGVALERSGAATAEAEAIFAPGSAFQIDLTPAKEVDRAGVAFFVTRDGEWRKWPVPEEDLRLAPSGAVKVAGRMTGNLVLEPGPWTLVVAVGRRSNLPSSKQAQACFKAADGCSNDDGWQMLRVSLRVVDDGGKGGRRIHPDAHPG